MADDTPRWATFDCYGTLVDWNGGIGDELARLFGEDRREALLARYHEHEPVLQASRQTIVYRKVMARSRRLARRRVGSCPMTSATRSGGLPDWNVFPEVPPALQAARDAAGASRSSRTRTAT